MVKKDTYKGEILSYWDRHIDTSFGMIASALARFNVDAEIVEDWLSDWIAEGNEPIDWRKIA